MREWKRLKLESGRVPEELIGQEVILRSRESDHSFMDMVGVFCYDPVLPGEVGFSVDDGGDFYTTDEITKSPVWYYILPSFDGV